MRKVCICVPARNEAERLPILLDALNRQTTKQPFRVALCVNNSDDGTALVAHLWAVANTSRLDLRVQERQFDPAVAHAGSARRAAMDLGVEVLNDDDGVLISTDADCRPPEDWVGAILEAIGDDRIIGGRIVLDDREAIDPSLLGVWRRLDAYWAKVRTLEDEIDPTPWDPPPRHGDHTGASLALTVGLYRKAGGVPIVPCGEDRALVDAAIAAGGRLVHPPSVWTRASARTTARAAGGMAAEIERLSRDIASGLTPMAPHFDHWSRRAAWRRDARTRYPDADVLRREQALDPMPRDMILPET